MIKKIASLIVSVGVAASLQAANTAFDNAANAPYNDGWQTLDNGGTGFGAWVLNGPGDNNGSHGGFFMGSSSGNAGGSSGNIDTSGRSWGMYANSGQTVSAIRPLTGGSLTVGQTITLSIDNGFLNSGSSEGFDIQTAGGANRFEFYYLAGGPNTYTYVDSTGSHAAGIGFTGDGLSLAFTLTGADTYSLAVLTPAGASLGNFSGTLEGTAGSGIGQLDFFDINGGNGQGSNGDFFVNLLTVPEPSTWVGGVMALGALFLFRVRRPKTA